MIFASNNENKLKELREIVGERIKIFSLQDIGITIEVEEDRDTLEENAMKKAIEVHQALPSQYKNEIVFSEDFGFFVNSLPNVAGVESKRWLDGTDADRNKEVIKLLEGKVNRSCYYKTVLALYDGKESVVFSECNNGKVALEQRGSNGFAYDKIFELENGKTFAELSANEKNQISSRKKAFMKMLEYLNLIV